jgi:ABC-type Fe3+-hydroxamate transport system substrate-binding protein
VGDETPGAHQTLNRLRRNPLWQRVTAIRENHILELTTYRHWIASGLLGKRRMIDEFVQCIQGGTT